MPSKTTRTDNVPSGAILNTVPASLPLPPLNVVPYKKLLLYKAMIGPGPQPFCMSLNENKLLSVVPARTVKTASMTRRVMPTTHNLKRLVAIKASSPLNLTPPIFPLKKHNGNGL